jgi:hypothetical protein
MHRSLEYNLATVQMPSPFQSTLLIVAGVLALIASAKWLVPKRTNIFDPRVSIEVNEALWIRALVIQGALWTLSLLVTVPAICRLWSQLHPPAEDLAATAISLLALVGLSFFAPVFKKGELDRLPNTLVDKRRLKAFAICGRLAALVPIFGFMLAGAGLARLHTNQCADITNCITEFLGLQSLSNVFLIVASIILTAGAAGGELRRRAANAIQPQKVSGRENLIFGLMYTSLLALVYIPTAIAASSAREAILGAALKAAGPDLHSWLELRKAAGDVLDLGESSYLPTEALSVIAPFAGGILAALFGKGSEKESTGD